MVPVVVLALLVPQAVGSHRRTRPAAATKGRSATAALERQREQQAEEEEALLLWSRC